VEPRVEVEGVEGVEGVSRRVEGVSRRVARVVRIHADVQERRELAEAVHRLLRRRVTTGARRERNDLSHKEWGKVYEYKRRGVGRV
jgi:hypothetical protein